MSRCLEIARPIKSRLQRTRLGGTTRPTSGTLFFSPCSVRVASIPCASLRHRAQPGAALSLLPPTSEASALFVQKRPTLVAAFSWVQGCRLLFVFSSVIRLQNFAACRERKSEVLPEKPLSRTVLFGKRSPGLPFRIPIPQGGNRSKEGYTTPLRHLDTIEHSMELVGSDHVHTIHLTEKRCVIGPSQWGIMCDHMPCTLVLRSYRAQNYIGCCTTLIHAWNLKYSICLTLGAEIDHTQVHPSTHTLQNSAV